MTKGFKNGTRIKNAREIYVEQLSHGRGFTGCINKKHEIFTNINPIENTDFAFRSTSNYLRHETQQTLYSSTEMNSGRYLPRAQSATDLSARTNRSTNGNPKYKAQEDYYDEIQALKKDMKTVKEENSNLRSKIRRLEEDNARKRKEIDVLVDPSKDGDLRRTLSGSNTDRNNNANSNATNVVMSLKQRLFKLELQLKQKETEIDELKSDPKRTKSTELEIQNRALLVELERQKFERLNYIQQNDYMGTIDEEKKNVVRKLNQEKDALKKENESLKKKLHDYQKLERGEQLSVHSIDSNIEKELSKKIEELEQVKENFDKIKHERDRLRRDLDHTKDELDEIRREHDQIKKKKKSKDNDDVLLEDVQRELEKANEEIKKLKRERTQLERKADESQEKLRDIERERNQYKKELNQVKDEFERQKQFKSNQSLKRSESPLERTTPFIRSNSPPRDDRQQMNKRSESPLERTTPLTRSDSPLRDDRQKTNIKPTFPSPRTSKSDLQSIDASPKRPTSANATNETAIQTVQASLRGYLNRSEIDKISDSTIGSSTNIKPKSTENQYKSDIMNRSTTSVLDSKTKLRRSFSPDDERPSSPTIKTNFGSKPSLSNDLNKYGPDKRSTTNIRDSAPKPHQSSSPPPVPERSTASPIVSARGSKSSLADDPNKFSRDKRPLSAKPTRPSREFSPDNISSPSKINPNSSKSSLKNIPKKEEANDDDDDDIVAF